MKVLVDTNVLLDVALRREPFFATSDAVVRWCENHPGGGFVAWHTLSNLYYVLRKAKGEAAARGFMESVLKIFEVAPTGTPAAKQALRLGVTDFEDALQISAALAAGADVIVTRDGADFASSPVLVQMPEVFFAAAPR